MTTKMDFSWVKPIRQELLEVVTKAMDDWWDQESDTNNMADIITDAILRRYQLTPHLKEVLGPDGYPVEEMGG